jgi:DNA modification methylase
LEPTSEEYVANIVAVMREVWRVLRGDGTVWLNLGDCYPGGNTGNQSNVGQRYGKAGSESGHIFRKDQIPSLKPKDLVGIPWRVAFALQADGWYLRSDIIWSKPNPMPESVKDRPTKSHEYMFLLTKSARYFWDQEAVKEPAIYGGEQLGIVRGQKRRASAMGRLPLGNEVPGSDANIPFDRNLRSVWNIPTESFNGAH